MAGRAGRVAVVGTAALFRKRAGNAAYLASFCRVLRRMGYRVEVFFLEPFPPDRIVLRHHADYLGSADRVALRRSLRLGSRFVSGNPRAWTAAGTRRLRSALGIVEPRRPDQPQGAQASWSLPRPDDAALRWARRRLSAFAPDIVVANYFNASPVFAAVGRDCLKAILTHDIFALRIESYRASGEAPDFDEEMIETERESLAAADLCLAITEREADFVRRRHPNLQTAVFPFVMEAAAQAAAAPSARRCLFIGSDNDPNRRALAWLLNEVWDRVAAARPEAELRVVGNLTVSDEFRGRSVTFTGPVDDLAEEYAAATVALVPLRAGSGLKIKLIEALAYGVPVVATGVGAEGVEGASSRFLRVHDDAEGFAAAIGEMLGAPDRAVRSREARAFADMRYSVAAAEAALTDAFERAARARGQSSRAPITRAPETGSRNKLSRAHTGSR